MAGVGVTSNLVSGPNLVGTRLFIAFILITFFFSRFARKLFLFSNKKPAIDCSIAGFLKIFVNQLKLFTRDIRLS
jgi:hypothetical protein